MESNNSSPEFIQIEKKVNDNDAVNNILEAFLHANDCNQKNCREKYCTGLKRNHISHIKKCTKKLNGGCIQCKYVYGFARIHSSDCTSEKCGMPFCNEAKLSNVAISSGKNKMKLENKSDIDESIKSFEHASSCKNDKCMAENCRYYKKKVFEHTKSCTITLDKNKFCICRTVLPLVKTHSDSCQDVKCELNFCSQMKTMTYEKVMRLCAIPKANFAPQAMKIKSLNFLLHLCKGVYCKQDNCALKEPVLEHLKKCSVCCYCQHFLSMNCPHKKPFSMCKDLCFLLISNPSLEDNSNASKI